MFVCQPILFFRWVLEIEVLGPLFASCDVLQTDQFMLLSVTEDSAGRFLLLCLQNSVLPVLPFTQYFVEIGNLAELKVNGRS